MPRPVMTTAVLDGSCTAWPVIGPVIGPDAERPSWTGVVEVPT